MRKTTSHTVFSASAAKKFNVKDINLPARSSLFLTAVGLLSKGAAFLFTPIFTRLLTEAQYGEYALFSSYLSVAVVIVSLELPGGVIMRAFQRERRSESITLLSASAISFVTAFPTVLALYAVRIITGGGMGFPFAYIFLFFSLISLSVINLYLSKCKFHYKWLPSLITALLQSVAAPIISIAFISVDYFSSFNHVTVKIGTVTAVLFLTATVILFITLREANGEARANGLTRRKLTRHSVETQKFLLKLALPLLPYYFSIMLISQSDKLLVSELIGKGALAKYSVAYSTGIALTALTGGIMGALAPWIMRKVRASSFDKIKETLDKIITLAVISVIIFLTAAPDLFRFLAPSGYSEALPVLFISAMIPIPLTLAQCSSSVAIAKERVGGVLLSGLIPAAVTLALGISLISVGGLSCAAAITAFGYFLLMTLGIINVRKITGKSIVNVNKTFQKLIFLAFSSATIYVFADILFIRAAIMILASLSLLYMLKPTFSLLKES